MKDKRLGVASIVAAALVATSLTACGGGSSAQSKASDNAGSEAGGAKKVVKYMTWESAETNTIFDEVVEELWDDPDVTIERVNAPSGDYGDKLGSLAQAQNLPDIFWCGNDTAIQYSQLGILVDWTSYLQGKMTPESLGGLERWTTDNGIGGVPSLRNVFGVWYNADLFEENGVPLPESGWNWDDLYSAAGALTGAGGSNFGLTTDMYVTLDGPFAMGTYSVSSGGQGIVNDVNAPTTVQADEYYVEGVTKLRDAIAAGYVAPPDYDVSNTTSLFAAGSQPMMIGGQWQAQALTNDAPDVNWAWVPLPHEKIKTTLYDAIGMCTPTTTASTDDTYKVVEFLNTEVIPEVMSRTPVAPPAFQPGQQAYFDSLEEMGATSVIETLEYSLNADEYVSLRLTTPYASQANDLTVATYLPILKGDKPVSDLSTYVDQFQALVDANQ
ncbi:extracellular solute-binding protein [Actinomycetaceae bacterium MB13-C1-2]|nr:extracellular solute-binding protein [Actinomycetaceae bacterium MB13-C1-2]